MITNCCSKDQVLYKIHTVSSTVVVRTVQEPLVDCLKRVFFSVSLSFQMARESHVHEFCTHLGRQFSLKRIVSNMATAVIEEPVTAGAFNLASNGPMSTAASITFSIYSGLFCCFTTISNFLVIYLVKVYPPLAIPPNVLLASLALADIFTGLIIGPIAVHYTITCKWTFGLTLCKVTTHTKNELQIIIQMFLFRRGPSYNTFAVVPPSCICAPSQSTDTEPSPSL